MIESIKKDTEERMKKSLESLSHGLAKQRTGRAHPSLLEGIIVMYYGQPTPISQVANVIAEDARTLTVKPWEKNMISLIDKAIRSSGLGLNPVTMGNDLKIPLPPLTEERRKEFVKQVRSEAEEARVSVRNIRRDANMKIKELLKEKEISEDDERRAEDIVQKLTDKHIQDIDKLLLGKETELMQV